jgi:hypothetical protein
MIALKQGILADPYNDYLMVIYIDGCLIFAIVDSMIDELIANPWERSTYLKVKAVFRIS